MSSRSLPDASPVRFAGAIYSVAALLTRASGLVLVPVYASRLTLSEYGEYALAQTFVAILPTLLTVGLTSTLVRRWFDEPDRRIALLRAGEVAWLLVATTAVGAFTLVSIALALQELVPARVALCIIAAATGASLAAVPTTFLRSAQRPIFAALVQLTFVLAAVLPGVIFVGLWDRGLTGAIDALAITGLLQGLIGLVFCAVTFQGFPNRESAREAFHFSLHLVPHALANQFQFIADRWALKAAGLGDDLGRYALASQVSMPAFAVVGAWNEAISPQMGEAFRTGNQETLALAWRRWVRGYALAASVPALGTLALLPGLSLLVGDSFDSALWLVPWFLVALVAETAYYPSMDVLFFRRRIRTIPALTISTAALSLTATFALTFSLGLPGALAARILASALRSLGYWIAARSALRTEVAL